MGKVVWSLLAIVGIVVVVALIAVGKDYYNNHYFQTETTQVIKNKY
jgi:uncharacterized membrane protein